jgi:hypothetical protein
MKRKREKHNYHTKWTPFARCTYLRDALGGEIQIPDDVVYLRNNIYTVHVEGCDVAPPMGPVAWLSIKRNDRQIIHDWRELQRIKNEIMGEECEAVEIYPAESRLHDTANQYHLWCFAPGYKLPFGYMSRFVADETNDPNSPHGNARQRPFTPDDKPDDCLRGADVPKMFGADPTLGAKLVHRRVSRLKAG